MNAPSKHHFLPELYVHQWVHEDGQFNRRHFWRRGDPAQYTSVVRGSPLGRWNDDGVLNEKGSYDGYLEHQAGLLTSDVATLARHPVIR